MCTCPELGIANTLEPELFAVVATALLTGLLWIPYLLNRIVEDGSRSALSASNLRPRALWAARLMRAHVNAVENLVVFAPLAVAVVVTHRTTPLTGVAAIVYFGARAAHAGLYVANVPVLRTLAFTAGFGSQLVLAWTLLDAR